MIYESQKPSGDTGQCMFKSSLENRKIIQKWEKLSKNSFVDLQPNLYKLKIAAQIHQIYI